MRRRHPGRAGRAGADAGPPDAIAVRRTEALGRWIGWLTDDAARALSVPLSDLGSACVGGVLLFAGADGTPARRAGTLLAHNGNAVHGVTRLDAGTRYCLYALRARPIPVA